MLPLHWTSWPGCVNVLSQLDNPVGRTPWPCAIMFAIETEGFGIHISTWVTINLWAPSNTLTTVAQTCRLASAPSPHNVIEKRLQTALRHPSEVIQLHKCKGHIRSQYPPRNEYGERVYTRAKRWFKWGMARCGRVQWGPPAVYIAIIKPLPIPITVQHI